MAKKKGGLGKGLDVLIRNKPASNKVQKDIDSDKEKEHIISNKLSEKGDVFEDNRNGKGENDSSKEISSEKMSNADQIDHDFLQSQTQKTSVEAQEELREEIVDSFENKSEESQTELNRGNRDGAETYEGSFSGVQDEKSEQPSVYKQGDLSNTTVYPEDADDAGEKVLIMKISAVEPNRDQPRKNFREEGIDELASSIAQYGIIQPLLVQKRDDYYEIIAGERRWRAAMKAGLKEVPVIVKDYSNREAVEISLIENIQREDLNPIEEALAYERLITEFEMTQEEVAGRVSKSRSAVTNSLRLLRLEGDIRQMVISGELSEGHARTLLGLPNEEMQKLLAERIIKEKLSVRDTERLVKKLTETKPKKTKEKDYQKEAILNNLSEQLKNTFGTKVSIIEKSRSRGKIEIEYYSDDELNRIFEMLQSVR